MNKESGYYFIKRLKESKWMVAFYKQDFFPPNCWRIIWDNSDGYSDEDFYEINETRILNPDEQEEVDFQNKADNER